MNTDCVVIFQKDVGTPIVADFLEKIKENNEELYDGIVSNLRNEDYGIREDILKFISEYAADFKTGTEYIYNMLTLIGNPLVTPEHLEWVVQYLNEENRITVSDFMIIFNEAVEKEIPLPEIKKLYEDAGEDEVQLYEKVVSYSTQGEQETAEIDKAYANDEDDEGTDNQAKGVNENNGDVPATTEKTDIMPDATDAAAATAGKGADNVADMFESLTLAMSHGSRGMDESVLTVQEEFNKIIAKFQLDLTEMASHVTQVIREWEKDIEEINRLTMLGKIQQKMLGNQQQRINELQGTILKQQDRIRNAEKSELQRAAIQQKITELGTLASGSLPVTFHDNSDVS